MPTSVSILARFLEIFITGFFKTMREKIVDGFVLAGALLYWALRRNFSAHVYEQILPWMWALCVIVSWHTIVATRLLYEELKNTPAYSRSTILSSSGVPLELPVQPTPKSRKAIIFIEALIITLCVLLAGGTFILARRESAPESKSETAQPIEPVISLFAKCDMISLPFPIPPHSEIRIVPVNERGMKANKWGSFEVRNDGDRPTQWPSKEAIRKARKPNEMGWFHYRCEISNHGSVNVLDVALPMQFTFLKDTKTQNSGETIQFTPVLSPLDAGKTFVLYFVNDCPVFATAILPRSATVLVAGEKNRRSTKLNLPNRNPVDSVMQWFGTNAHWVNWTQCEEPTPHPAPPQ